MKEIRDEDRLKELQLRWEDIPDDEKQRLIIDLYMTDEEEFHPVEKTVYQSSTESKTGARH